jgi:hypothetical protein
MFEGFPTAFAAAALADGTNSWTTLPGLRAFDPISFPGADPDHRHYAPFSTPPFQGCNCAVVDRLNCSAHSIDQTAVEDHVADLLIKVSKDFAAPGLALASRDESMAEIIDVIKAISETTRPTYRLFRREWLRRHPAYSLQGVGRPEGGYTF